MLSRRHFLGGSSALLFGAALAGRAFADSGNANRLLFGYPPGAVGSQLASALLPMLAAHGGPSYHLENLDGRSTRLARDTAARAAADGTTLLQTISASMTLLPSVYKDSAFDAMRDFSPLGSMGDFPYVLAVGALVPASVQSLKQYLAWISDNPEYRNVGISIYGSIGHLAVRTLVAATEVPMRVQPYQGTTGLMADLRSQSLASAFLAPGSGVGIEANSPIRAIAVTSRERLTYWPQVPTIAEQGVPQMDFTAWFGWFAQAATPAATLQSLREAVARLQASAEYAPVLKHLLLTPVNLDAEQITARMRNEIARFKSLVDGFGISKYD